MCEICVWQAGGFNVVKLRGERQDAFLVVEVVMKEGGCGGGRMKMEVVDVARAMERDGWCVCEGILSRDQNSSWAGSSCDGRSGAA